MAIAVALAFGLTITEPAARQTTPASTVTCTSIGLTPTRAWTFARENDTWRVTHVVTGETRRATLLLPNAAATFGDAAISLRARTANGGIDVTLSGSWQRATLDAYVNYELEVNVDASLTPDIDDISTEAPTGVRCVRTPP